VPLLLVCIPYMLYPDSLESKLGFDRIRQLLKNYCVSTLGTTWVEEMAFMPEFDQVQRQVQQTAEFLRIIQSGEYFPEQNFLDVSKHLHKARPLGAFLTEDEFQEVKLSLTAVLHVQQFYKKWQEQYPVLAAESAAVMVNKDLLQSIERIIDERGHIRDYASRELREIRGRLRAEESRLRREMDRIMKHAKGRGFTPEDLEEMSVRNGRLVVPVLAEHKRHLRGFIHGESATGQTVFIEPASVLDINNEISDLRYQERREIIKILTLLTDELRPEVPLLQEAYAFLGRTDFTRAKARLARDTESIMPRLHNKRLVQWTEARHPLLYLSFKEHGKAVVPLTINLDGRTRILVVSGPNAGGKSVTLKTLGLLQYMLQCGLLVPMKEGSEMGLFQNLFVDIGDEQSLENDLSTYSSHLTNMKRFVTMANKQTLFLIDEFGTGTEPHFGGAIAQSILVELNKSQAYGVVTTHYANLKKMAEQTPGIANAAMRFDLANLVPLYSLEVGKPGSSFALEIARKIGLPNAVLDRAQAYAGYDQVKYDRLLTDLQKEKEQLQERQEEARRHEQALARNRKEYEELRQFISQKRKELLNEAKAEAKGILADANRKIEQTIKQIKESNAEQQRTKQVRKELEDYKETVKPEPVKTPKKQQQEQEEITLAEGPIEVGSWVRIKGQPALGKVMTMKGKDVELMIGDLKSTVKLNRLEKITRKEAKQTEKAQRRTSSGGGMDMTAKMANFSSSLDLRGKRVSEALPQLEQFIDDALLVGTQELRIVHGKGDGVLRNLVRQELRKFKQVSHFEDEHADRGGPGVTLVTISA